MGANTNIDDNPHLLHMLQHGWFNVAEGTPDHTMHTYGNIPDWDRVTKCPRTSRIDYIIANQAARSLVTDFCYLRDLPAKSHVGLQVTLDLSRLDHTARRLLAPTPYPPDDGAHEGHELQALGTLIAGRYQDRMEQADTRDDVERMFALANEASHEYHLTRLRDLPPPPPDHPKKKPPTMHGLTPTFEERPVVPRAFPTYGASTIHMNRLRKLHRQLCELRFIGQHHHLDCRAIPPYLAQRIDCTWAAARLLCHKLRPTVLLDFPEAWSPDGPVPHGEHLDRLIQNLDSELARRANRAKAERIKIWAEGVREPSGRKAAIYARAADCSPTAYLRTPTTPDDAQLHCDTDAFHPDKASTDDSDADTEAGGVSPRAGSSPDTDNDEDHPC
ncbi:MAG: hypothetical protein GY811_16445, partial [Myxococcales bacterium]|nr:hypothetical protein [Myxococcales bacterium]